MLQHDALHTGSYIGTMETVMGSYTVKSSMVSPVCCGGLQYMLPCFP